MDRNIIYLLTASAFLMSLSARRAWIEIETPQNKLVNVRKSLSARRAWIEIASGTLSDTSDVVALRKESVDRNSYL